MSAIGEERLHLLRVLLDRQALIRRQNSAGQDLQHGIIAVVVLGDRVGEPRQVTGRGGGVGLLLPQRRVGGRLFGQPTHQEVQLDVCRFLHPQRAVVIEDGDPGFGLNVIRPRRRHPGDEVDDRRLRRSGVPGVQACQAQPPIVSEYFLSFSTAAVMVNDAGSARGGNSLNVSRNSNTNALPYRAMKMFSKTQSQ